MPKVSVIVPVYGVEKYIERCARSLFEQTLDNIEYLFIDDCTPDHSIEILQRVLEEYPHRLSQVILHRMEQNSGQAAARKWGMQNATGEYIIHCDSDDWVEIDMMKSLYDIALKENSCVVISDYNNTDGTNTSLRKGAYNIDVKSVKNDMLSQRISWALWNKLVKRELIKDIEWPESNMGEDMAMVFQILNKCNRIAYIERPLYNYFINNESISKIKGKEKELKRFEQIYNNSIMVLKNTSNCNRDAIVCFKYFVKSYLSEFVNDKQVFRKWKGVYSEINTKVLLSRRLSWKEKMVFLLTYLRLYPILRNL